MTLLYWWINAVERYIVLLKTAGKMRCWVWINSKIKKEQFRELCYWIYTYKQGQMWNKGLCISLQIPGCLYSQGEKRSHLCISIGFLQNQNKEKFWEILESQPITELITVRLEHLKQKQFTKHKVSAAICVTICSWAAVLTNPQLVRLYFIMKCHCDQDPYSKRQLRTN